MKQVGLCDEIPPPVWACDWTVHCQAVSAAEATLTYLAPSVLTVAISHSRIVKVEEGRVVFRYAKPHSSRLRTMALPVMEFIRRFLQHVLPTGLTTVRYDGFLSPTSSVPLEEVTTRIEVASGFAVRTPETASEPLPSLTCRHGGGPLISRLSILPHHHRHRRAVPQG